MSTSNLRLLLLASCSAFLSACHQVPAPEPFGPLPSESQLEWQKMERYGFIHFSMNTFTDEEWGFGAVDPKTFNPTELDARQWVKTFKDAGLKGLILTCKHHDGFCLWPSKYTEYSVKNSPWRGGKGDLVKEVSDACREFGLKFGVYLSPWDRNHAQYGKPEYITYFRNQLTELLTNYGDIFEVWFDGANGGSGYYGGANETRSVDRQKYYDWETTNALVYKLQPKAIIFSDAGPGCRWCGNESGWAGETNWSLLRRDEVWPGFPNSDQLWSGHVDGTHWVASEVDVSVRPGWFYHASEDHKLKSLQQLVDIYYTSVGRNGTNLLNIPPDKRGLIHEDDVARLIETRKMIEEDFANNLISEADTKADNVRGNSSRYESDHLTDNDNETYWATDDHIKTASVEIELGDQPVEFNRILLQEYIRLGQRVSKFSVEALVDGKWTEIDKQTTIGYKRILRLPATKATKIRVNILESKACPVISNIEVYNAPKHLIAPSITRDREGLVKIEKFENDIIIKYSTDGGEPSKVYDKPFPTSGKTLVKAVVSDPATGKSSSVASQQFDVLRNNWKLVGEKDENSKYMFDGDPYSVWHKRAPKMPIALTIDMGKEETLCGFQYLPDQNRWSAGIIFNYTLAVSENGRQWKEVSQGEFSNIRNHPIKRTIEFGDVKARYIRFTANSNTSGDAIAGYAEIDVLTR